MKTIIIYGLNKQNTQRLKEQTTGVELTASREDPPSPETDATVHALKRKPIHAKTVTCTTTHRIVLRRHGSLQPRTGSCASMRTARRNTRLRVHRAAHAKQHPRNTKLIGCLGVHYTLQRSSGKHVVNTPRQLQQYRQHSGKQK